VEGIWIGIPVASGFTNYLIHQLTDNFYLTNFVVDATAQATVIIVCCCNSAAVLNPMAYPAPEPE
jgi:hypothetical protein